MAKYLVVRDHFTPTSTHGTLFRAAEGCEPVQVCYTLEDVVRSGPKVPGETAIPAGTYPLLITYSNRFKRLLPLVDNVPGFAGIRMHGGNTSANTEGCLLVADFRDLEHDRVFHACTDKIVGMLHADLQDGPVTIEVR